MNKLSPERRAAVIQALVEGNSIRAACRLTGAAKGTVTRLLVELGEACVRFHNATVRNVTARRVECDEIWSFVGCKERNVARSRNPHAVGDAWTWVGIDADSKLAIAWLVADHDADAAEAFVRDLSERLAHRVQLSTDGHRVYLQAVENVFGWNNIDYAMLVKMFARPLDPDGRYSPPTCIGAKKIKIMGQPKLHHVSTSFVERSNLTMRMQMRRFTRLTNAFSKKLENHAAAVALHFVHYNFCRVHATLTKRNGGIHTTPAMAAGYTTYVWTAADIVALLDRPSLRLVG